MAEIYYTDRRQQNGKENIRDERNRMEDNGRPRNEEFKLATEEKDIASVAIKNVAKTERNEKNYRRRLPTQDKVQFQILRHRKI